MYVITMQQQYSDIPFSFSIPLTAVANDVHDDFPLLSTSSALLNHLLKVSVNALYGSLQVSLMNSIVGQCKPS